MKTILLLAALVMSCTKSPAPSDSASASSANWQALASREWRLVELDGRTDPLAAGAKPVTLRFDEGSRAVGFAGCNQYFSSYTIRGDSITFGAVGATRMACSEGMDVEQAYLGALPRVVRFTIADSTLTFFSATGPIARYK